MALSVWMMDHSQSVAPRQPEAGMLVDAAAGHEIRALSADSDSRTRKDEDLEPSQAMHHPGFPLTNHPSYVHTSHIRTCTGTRGTAI